VGAQGLQGQPDERCDDDQREERATEDTVQKGLSERVPGVLF